MAQVWRGSARQHALVRLLRAESVRVDALSEPTAYQVGLLLGASRSADVTDAHVASLARSLSAKVLTSGADDLRRLDPKIEIVPV